MCVSRLHRVVGAADQGAVDVEDVEGERHRASLIAFDGPAPVPGEWVVVHSGYVLDRVDPADARGVVREVRRAFEGRKKE